MSGSKTPVIDIDMTTPPSSTTTKLTTPTQVAVAPTHTSEQQKRPLASTDKKMPKEKKEKKDKKSKSVVSKSLSPLLSPGISLMNADEGRGDKVPDGASGGCEDVVLGKILSQVQKLDLIEKKLDSLETTEREVTRMKTDLQEYKESLTYTQGQLADACEEVESLKLKMQQNDERENKLE